jgi:hypothetical protein
MLKSEYENFPMSTFHVLLSRSFSGLFSFMLLLVSFCSSCSDEHSSLLLVSFCRTIVLAATILLDWWMYGSQVIVPLNFLKFNLFSSGGNYYGTHVFHWYFTQGFPSMIWTFLPLAMRGIMKSREWRLSGLIAWVLGVYSILGHKEFRYFLQGYSVLIIS